MNIIKNPLQGGKAFASGGFGCLFDPSLKCEQEEEEEEKAKNDDPGIKRVSKLMFTKNAKREYNEIVKFKTVLETIPNYEKYFLIEHFTVCSPSELREDDLTAFDKKCKALTKKKVSAKNINKRFLNRLKTVNMPYGGPDVGEYIKKERLNFSKMIEMNTCLMNLLERGILPMNEKGVYHCDLKESNILVDVTNPAIMKTRIIDWGLSTKYFKRSKAIPKVLLNRPFQYNVPFSSVLFNQLFQRMYKEFLEENEGYEIGYLKIRAFVVRYVTLWIDERGPGHLKLLNDILKKFFENDLTDLDQSYREDLIEFSYTFYFIFEYISKILFTYTKNGKLDLQEYFSKVFMKNIDVWGFTMTYIPIMEELYKHHKELNEKEQNIVDKIKECVYLIIESSDTVINVKELLSRLEELNILFEIAGRNRTPTRRGSYRSSFSQKTTTMKSKSKSSSRSKTRKSSSK